MNKLTRTLRINAIAIQAYADKLDDAYKHGEFEDLASHLEARCRELLEVANKLRNRPGTSKERQAQA